MFDFDSRIFDNVEHGNSDVEIGIRVRRSPPRGALFVGKTGVARISFGYTPPSKKVREGG